MASPVNYLGVYKALYSYEAQGEDEVAIEEDQLVFVLDNSDDEYDPFPYWSASPHTLMTPSLCSVLLAG